MQSVGFLLKFIPARYVEKLYAPCTGPKKNICIRCASGRTGITSGSKDIRTFK